LVEEDCPLNNNTTRDTEKEGEREKKERKGTSTENAQRKAATLASSHDDSDGLEVIPWVCFPIQFWESAVLWKLYEDFA